MSLFGSVQTYYTKTGTTGYVNGVYSAGEWIPQTFIGTIQPMKSLEIKNLEIGEIVKGAVKVYTESNLKVSRKDEEMSDLILFVGDYYKLVSKSSYKSGLIEHFKYEAILYEKGIE